MAFRIAWNWIIVHLQQSPESLVFWDWNPLVAVGFPAERSSNAETVFMSWRYNSLQGQGWQTANKNHADIQKRHTFLES